MISSANLISRHYSIDSAINVKLKYSNTDTRYSTFRIGDDICLSYKSDSNIKYVSGIIADVIIRKDLCSTSFKYNEKECEGTDVIFKIDTSVTEVVTIVSVNLSEIIDMTFGDDLDDLHTSGLISNRYNIKYTVSLKFNYDNKTSNVIKIRLGDEVTISRYDDESKSSISNVTGVIFDIINKKEELTTSFLSNRKSGNGGYDLLFRLNKSNRRTKNDIENIYLISIFDIGLGDTEDNDPYPPIPYRDPEPLTEDPVDPSVMYNVSITTNFGTIEDPNRTVAKNDNVDFKVEYDDFHHRLTGIKINGVEYSYDKTKGLYNPALPTNIGVTEVLPTTVSMLNLIADVEGQYMNIDFDLEDEETQRIIDMYVVVYLSGSVEIKILTVENDYDIELIFGPNVF